MGDMKKCCDLSAVHVILMEEIFAWLPMESVCRFRSLSKEWNARLSSTKFITQKWVMKPPNRDPWLVAAQLGRSLKWVENGSAVVQAAGSLASCFFNQTWNNTSSVLSLSFLQQYPEENRKTSIDSRCYGIGSLQQYPEEDRRYSIDSMCYGSAAGLLLLSRSNAMASQLAFIVCNPITRKYVELPVLSSENILNAGIMSDSGDSYKVVVMGMAFKESLSLKVQIYNSIDKSWRIAGHLPENVKGVEGKLVFCNGYFYCLAIIYGQRTVVGYNIGEGTSIFRPLPEIADRHFMVPQLFTCGSRVLVAAHILGVSEQLLEVIIWELDKVNSSSSSSWWKEIARMPPSDLQRFSMNGTSRCGYFVDCTERCVGMGDIICFTVFQQRKVKEMLAYSITENRWSWLPSRPLDTTAIASRWGCCEIPMAFEPRPDMKVD